MDPTILARLEAIEAGLKGLVERNGAPGPWPEWMSPTTAARYCDCSPWRIGRAIKNGYLVVARPEDGGQRKARPPEPRIKRNDLDAWMEAGRPTSPLPHGPDDGTMDGQDKLAKLRGETT